jgi:hypothetical protein
MRAVIGREKRMVAHRAKTEKLNNRKQKKNYFQVNLIV